jgi:hypothetical protein
MMAVGSPTIPVPHYLDNPNQKKYKEKGSFEQIEKIARRGFS